MGFKLFEVFKPEEKNALENLKILLVDTVKKKNRSKKNLKPEDTDYDEVNVISFRRSLYRLNTNYHIKDQKDLT